MIIEGLNELNAESLYELPPAEPSDWIVEGLLRTRRNRPSLIAGFPGAGKSTLARQLAIAVSTGAEFLGRKTKRSRVICWLSEESDIDVRDSFINAGMSKDSDLLFLLPEDGDDNFKRLTASLDAHPETRLVIIETLGDFVNIPELNSNDDTKTALKKISNQLNKSYPNCCFVVLHHLGKSNECAKLSIMKILGGTQIPALTDAKLLLEVVSDQDDRRILKIVIRKGIPLMPTYLDFDEETSTMTLGKSVADAKIYASEAARAQKVADFTTSIRKIADENPGINKTTLIRIVGGKTVNTSLTIDAMISGGLLISVPGEKNSQHLYIPGAEPRPAQDNSKDPVECAVSDVGRIATRKPRTLDISGVTAEQIVAARARRKLKDDALYGTGGPAQEGHV